MLTRHEVRWNLTNLRIASHLCVIPLDFDPERGNARVTTSSTKKRFFRLQFILAFIYAIFLASRLIHIVVFAEINPLDTTLHAVLLQITIAVLYTTFKLHIHSPEGTVLVFNELHNSNEGKTKFKWRKYTLQEIFTIFFPLSDYIGWSMIVPLIIMKPTRSYFLGSAFDLNSTWRIVLVVGAEISVHYFICTQQILSVFMQLSMFQNVSCAIKKQMEELRSLKFPTADNLSSAIRRSKIIQLNIQLYNFCFANEHYLMKFTMTVTTVSFIFCGFKMIHVSPIDGIPLLVCGAELILGFILMYDKAFGVPSMMDELKEVILMTSVRSESKTGHHLSKRKIQSVRNTGIKVGSFHNFERTSTPQFVNFVFASIINLLVAF